MPDVQIYDTTLRDGAQSEDVAFTLEDELRITECLDDLGVHYIEGGMPGSNAKDKEYFREVKKLNLKHAKIAAFSSTRRPTMKAENDENLKFCIEAKTPVITLVGKTCAFQATEVLEVSLEENIDIITSSIKFAKQNADEIIFDAEHFFDGLKNNSNYTQQCIKSAFEAGADLICLCDTNGGSLPFEIINGAIIAKKIVKSGLGIHCHNDCEMAVANTLEAVECRILHVQGTMNGFGERCGNTNLSSIIPILQIKRGYSCISEDQLMKLTSTARLIYELANIEPFRHQPFVGRSAFTHKGGIHASGIKKSSRSYEHIDPFLVGNKRRITVSELPGKSNILFKAKEFGIEIDDNDPKVKEFLEEIKALENQGYQFEGADASLELRLRKVFGNAYKGFKLLRFSVRDEKRKAHRPPFSEATIMIEGPDNTIEHQVADGNGPVNALDRALRRALIKFYPEVDKIKLIDYKVRILGSRTGTGALVRVLIESGYKEERWGTVGVSHNVIEASWQALEDSYEYFLMKKNNNKE